MRNFLLLTLLLLLFNSNSMAQASFEKQFFADSFGVIYQNIHADYDKDGDKDIITYGVRYDFAFSCYYEVKWWENDNGNLNYRGLASCYNLPLMGTGGAVREFFTAKINDSDSTNLIHRFRNPNSFSMFFRTNFFNLDINSVEEEDFIIYPAPVPFSGSIYVDGYNFIDMNNDGLDDVFRYINNGNYAVQRNAGDAVFYSNSNTSNIDTVQFQLDSIIPPTDNFEYYDLDGNGTKDWVFSNNENQNFYWMSNNGNSNFENVKLLQSFDKSIDEYWFEDIDGDSDLDFIANNDEIGIESYKNDGAGNFSYDQLLYPSNSELFKVADLNNNGFKDIVIVPGVLNIDSTISYKTIWLRNVNNQNYVEHFVTNDEVTSCLIANVNGDDLLDIIDFSYHENGNLYYYSNIMDQDSISPIASCKDSVSVYLDESGEFALEFNDLDDGSFDSLGIDDYLIDFNPFDCSDSLSNLIAELTVFDFAGNFDVCTAEISVLDTIAPIVICRDSSVFLAFGDSITIPASELLASYSDNCSVEEIQSSQTIFYSLDTDCYSVVLTVIDNSGNLSECTAEVCITDPTTSVGVNYGTSISIYPNPSSNIINVSLSKNLPFNFDINLIDMSGRVVMESKNNAKSVELECSDLSKGMYLLNISNSVDKSTIYNQQIAIQ